MNMSVAGQRTHDLNRSKKCTKRYYLSSMMKHGDHSTSMISSGMVRGNKIILFRLMVSMGCLDIAGTVTMITTMAYLFIFTQMGRYQNAR